VKIKFLSPYFGKQKTSKIFSRIPKFSTDHPLICSSKGHFFRTSRPILINRGSNQSFDNFRELEFFYEGPGPLQRGGNHKNRVGSFKISRTTGPEKLRFT
jgi:hypothetical protein